MVDCFDGELDQQMQERFLMCEMDPRVYRKRAEVSTTLPVNW